MSEERFRQTLDGIGPPTPPAGLDTDILVARGRRAARNRNVRLVAACAVIVATVPITWTLADTSGDRQSTVDRPSPLPASSPTVAERSHITDEGVDECSTLVRSIKSNNVYKLGSLRGLEQISTKEGTTILVGTDATRPTSTDIRWVCNLKPDEAVSGVRDPSKGGIPASDSFAWNFRVAAYALDKVEPGSSGSLVWAGGVAPRATTDIRYHFPDGHIESAVITPWPAGNGAYWVMQYVSPEVFESDDPPIRVEIRPGWGGEQVQSTDLEWGKETCTVVSHGC